MPYQISRTVINAYLERLRHPAMGFNQTYADIISRTPEYGNLKPLTLDFDLGGKNLILGAIDFENLLESKHFQFPLVQIYPTEATDTPSNEQKRRVFGGVVPVRIDFHNSWVGTKLGTDQLAPGDAIEDTMFTMFNTPDVAHQSWERSHPGVLYGGEMSALERSAIIEGGIGFRQLIPFQLTAELQL